MEKRYALKPVDVNPTPGDFMGLNDEIIEVESQGDTAWAARRRNAAEAARIFWRGVMKETGVMRIPIGYPD